MATTENKLLWKELKKEYIEDLTVEQFRERVSDLLRQLSERPVYADKEDKQQLLANVGMLASYLLSDGDHPLALPAYVAFMDELRQMNPRLSDLMVKTVLQRIRYEKVAGLGFSGASLSEIGTDVFIHNVCKHAKFENPLTTPMLYSGYGTAVLTDQGLMLTHETKDATIKILKEGADSLDTGLGVSLRTSKNEKLKLNHVDSVVHMDEFAKSFIQSQARVKNNASVRKPLLAYDEGDEVIVRVTAVGHDIRVETTDPAYHKIEGVVRYNRQSIVYYNTDNLYQYFRVGDYIPVTVRNPYHGIFDIEKQLVQFFVEFADDVVTHDGDTMPAKLIHEKSNYTVWLTEIGVAVRVDGPCKYRRGDYADITIDDFGEGKFYGLIRGHVHGNTDIRFDEDSARYDCMRVFAEFTEVPANQEPEEDTAELSPVLLRLLLRMLFDYQKSLLKPSDRFRYLAIANVMAKLVGDDLSASYIGFARTYLRALIQFVNGEDLNAIELHPDEEFSQAKSTQIRLSVIEILKEYGKKENSVKLAEAISLFEKDLPQLARLARLIQTANSMQDIFSDSARNVIHREIIRSLSLETEKETDLEADRGLYLGVESGTQEFKTSMVYPPGNKMQPNETTQNANIMKALCAFLNSTTGGTLYLGVNDQGYIVGIDNDMKYLKLQSIDGYMRYVQDIAKKHFGVDTLPYIRIEPLYDDRVVALHIEPHPYRVVEFKDKPYIRVNAESRIMPELMRLELIDRKMFTNKDKAAAISHLQHACTKKCCAILHNYASNNSGGVEDRYVEPYDVKADEELVICYDINKNGTRIFNINRIGYVEILEDKPWTNMASHKPVYVDVFHMSGQEENQFEVSLQLDLMAKNLLVEEFPRAKEYISGQKGDENIWYFKSKICSPKGIGRFYIGLANHITILEGAPLKQYAAEYVAQFLAQSK